MFHDKNVLGDHCFTFQEIMDLSRLYYIQRDCRFMRIFVESLPLKHHMITICEDGNKNQFDWVKVNEEGFIVTFSDDGRYFLIAKSETPLDFMFRTSEKWVNVPVKSTSRVRLSSESQEVVGQNGEFLGCFLVSNVFGYLKTVELLLKRFFQFGSSCEDAATLLSLGGIEDGSYRLYLKEMCHSEEMFPGVIALCDMSACYAEMSDQWTRKRDFESILNKSNIDFSMISRSKVDAEGYYFDFGSRGVNVDHKNKYSYLYMRNSDGLFDSFYRVFDLGIDLDSSCCPPWADLSVAEFIKKICALLRLNFHFGFRYFLENVSRIALEKNIVWGNYESWVPWCIDLGIPENYVLRFRDLISLFINGDVCDQTP